jgi:uncharacterized protein (DUF779 family)
MTDKPTYTTLSVPVEDGIEIRYTAWYERQKIADLVPMAVRVFSLMTPQERAEILARQHCTPA